MAGVLTPATVLAHRVAAADGADDGLADELEAAARREMDAGTPALGARNLLWASSLSRTTEQAERRLLQAVRALLDGAQTAQAAGLRAQLEVCPDSPTRSVLLGEMDWELGDSASAERWLRQAATDATAIADWGCAGWAWAQLAEVYVTQGRAQDAIDAANQALALTESGPRVERLAWICLATGRGNAPRRCRLGWTGCDSGCPSRPEQVPDDEANMLVTRGTLGLYAGQTTGAISDHRAVLRAAKRTLDPPDRPMPFPDGHALGQQRRMGRSRGSRPHRHIHRLPTTSRYGSKPNATPCWPPSWPTGATGTRPPTIWAPPRPSPPVTTASKP